MPGLVGAVEIRKDIEIGALVLARFPGRRLDVEDG
jgi:hypothetical protein